MDCMAKEVVSAAAPFGFRRKRYAAKRCPASWMAIAKRMSRGALVEAVSIQVQKPAQRTKRLSV